MHPEGAENGEDKTNCEKVGWENSQLHPREAERHQEGGSGHQSHHGFGVGHRGILGCLTRTISSIGNQRTKTAPCSRFTARVAASEMRCNNDSRSGCPISCSTLSRRSAAEMERRSRRGMRVWWRRSIVVTLLSYCRHLAGLSPVIVALASHSPSNLHNCQLSPHLGHY